MTLHVVGLPWTATTDEYLTCAYTQKLIKFCRMHSDRDVILYATEENDAPCSEHVALLSEAERAGYFGEWGSEALLQRVIWDNTQEPWVKFNERAIEAILARGEREDLVLLVGGNCQQPIAAAVSAELLAVEPFVGYEGIFTHAAFESHAWRSHVYGLMGLRNGRWYDATIPNYFDLAEFDVEPEHGDYLLFVGRMVERKGPHIAAQIAEAAGLPLKVAGPGALEWTDTRIRTAEVTLESSAGLEYVGEVGVEERAELMAGAAVLLAPTMYIEPFGGVTVEAMLSGTPVVATDWGSFTEIIEQGVNGYRFRTLAEGVESVYAAAELDPGAIQSLARDRYSLAAIRPLYDRWFAQLGGLWGEGWPALGERSGMFAQT
jgi:glycosyltransferase involved in cell wall biosynthesis